MPALRSTQPSMQGVLGFLPRGKVEGCEVDHSPLSMPRLRMGASIVLHCVQLPENIKAQCESFLSQQSGQGVKLTTHLVSNAKVRNEWNCTSTAPSSQHPHTQLYVTRYYITWKFMNLLTKHMATILACLSHSFIKLSVCANR